MHNYAQHTFCAVRTGALAGRHGLWAGQQVADVCCNYAGAARTAIVGWMPSYR